MVKFNKRNFKVKGLMKGKFRHSVENFRGIAIIFVMLSHISSIQNMGKIGDIFYYTFADATAWFVFISGYLFYYLEINKFDYFDYLYKKIKFVLFPYFVLSIPAIFFWIYLSKNVLYGLSSFNFLIWSIISGGIAVGPMWFIPMISIFFILTPMFRFFSKTNLIYLFFLISIIFSIFSFRPVYNANALLSFFHFCGFYIFGIVVAKKSDNIEKLSKNIKIVLVIVGLCIFFISGFMFSGISKIPPSFFSGLGELNLILLGKFGLLLAIFLSFEMFFEHKNVVLAYLAKISFGLFFIHGFVSLIFHRISRSIYFPIPSVIFICEIFTIVFVSILLIFLLKKILGKWSRYVIGC